MSFIMATACSPNCDLCEKVGNVTRRWCSDTLGKIGQPVGHESRIVIDDVVDAALPMGECGNGCSRRIVQVKKRPDPGPLADDRDIMFANLIHHGSVGREWS